MGVFLGIAGGLPELTRGMIWVFPMKQKNLSSLRSSPGFFAEEPSFLCPEAVIGVPCEGSVASLAATLGSISGPVVNCWSSNILATEWALEVMF
jgi:hypothetical protein